ncbi:hypothetical protein N9Q00_00445 [Amylibacter sp.]|nr:hypothetical protein [Amylibacter sp.]MDB9785470.1 hypothetical protein [Amylibacter sp.]
MPLSDKPKIYLLGAGGHAAVLMDIMKHNKIYVSCIYSPSLDLNRRIFHGVRHSPHEDEILTFNTENVLLVNGIGLLPENSLRLELNEKFKSRGFKFLSVIAQSAEISPYAILGEGVQILNGSVVQAGSIICDDTILNSRSLIEHDCHIGPMNHIAPSATLCGSVTTGANVFVGSGAVVLPNSKIQSGFTVKANSLNKF